MKSIVFLMSGLVVAISIFFMIATLGGMNRGNAEWDVTVYAYTGTALLVLAATVIWRTLAAHTAVWEAAVQYIVSGGLLARTAFRHAFHSESVMLAQIHLAVTGLFCLWNLYSIYRHKRGPR